MVEHDSVWEKLQPGGGLNLLRGVFDALGETLPGSLLGGYRVGQRMGRAGSLQAFEAYRADGVVGSTMALQVLFGEPQTEVDQLEFTRRLRQLARCRHPVLDPPIDGGVTSEGLRFVVASQIDGTPLDKYCDLACLPIRQRLKLLISAMEALAYAHACGLVHGCVQPDEILVSRDGHVRLCHTSFFWLFSDRYGASVFAPASPVFSPPEVLLGEQPSHRSDIYQLGVTIAHVLFGETVASERRMSQAISDALAGRTIVIEEQLLSQTPNDASRRILRLVKDCVCLEPERRIATVDLVRAEIESISSTLG